MLVRKPEEKRSLEEPRRRWVDNINMDLRVMGFSGTDWTELNQDRTSGGFL
jgi:hypothetical protein